MVGSNSVALSVFFLTYSLLPKLPLRDRGPGDSCKTLLPEYSWRALLSEQGKRWTVRDMENDSSFMAPYVPSVWNVGFRQSLLISQLLDSSPQLQRAT